MNRYQDIRSASCRKEEGIKIPFANDLSNDIRESQLQFLDSLVLSPCRELKTANCRFVIGQAHGGPHIQFLLVSCRSLPSGICVSVNGVVCVGALLGEVCCLLLKPELRISLPEK